MIFSQIPLDFWDERYESGWIVGESNQMATDILLRHDGQIYLTGPRFCGKKHVAIQITKLQQRPMSENDVGDAPHILFLECMKDCEIVAEYDLLNAQGQKAIWVANGYTYAREFSKDVLSRLNAMQCAEIKELSEDMVFALMSSRLTNLGFVVKNEIINYCVYRIPRSYLAVELCVRYVKKVNCLSFKAFKEFFVAHF